MKLPEALDKIPMTPLPKIPSLNDNDPLASGGLTTNPFTDKH